MRDVIRDDRGIRYAVPAAGLQSYRSPYPRAYGGNDAGARISGSDVVRIHDVKGTWAKVSIDGDIVGWVDGQRLRPAGAPERTFVAPPRDRLTTRDVAVAAPTFPVTA